MNILIVEDSSLELRRICRLVQEAKPDTRIMSFSDSSQVMTALEVERVVPDVAFLDIEMPSPTGLELAERLNRRYPRVNVIFTTAYTEYMQKAFAMYVSGYLCKPFSLAEISDQLEHLRYPVSGQSATFYAKTRGEFDFYCNGQPVTFTLSRAKEMLAYLIDREGASVTRKQVFAILFEDTEYSRSKQDYMKKIIQALKTGLEEVGGGDILRHAHNCYSVDMTRFASDIKTVRSSGEEYMEQYSWAEGRYR